MRKWLLIFCAALLPLQVAEPFFPHGSAGVTHPANWYNPSWGFRKTITIDHTKVSTSGGETYVGFPVLVSEATDASLAAHAKSNGFDILFTSSDGTTKINHELETFNSATGKLVAWVQVSGLSTSVDSVLYMYYGNPGASDQQNVAGTWDSHYKGVYHLAASNTQTTFSRSAPTAPIINYGGSGWKSFQLLDPVPLIDPQDPTKILLFFGGGGPGINGINLSIGRATASIASDLTNSASWTEYAGNPVIGIGPGVCGRRVDSVIVINANLLWLYSTNCDTNDISLFTSTDNGFTWTLDPASPVLTPTGQGRNDGTVVSQGSVFRDGLTTWTMIYSYRTSTVILPGFRYATSSDGKTWTKGGAGDILSNGPNGSSDVTLMEDHQIFKIGSTYLMFYDACVPGLCLESGAYSSSLTSGWQKFGANPIFQGSKVAGSFDKFHSTTAGVFQAGSVWYMLYTGNGNVQEPYGNGNWAMGIAVLSGSPIDLVTGGVKDSTANANHMSGINLTQATGKIGGGFTFDGYTAHASSFVPASTVTNNYTIQAWAKAAILPQSTITADGTTLLMNGLTNEGGSGSGVSINLGYGAGTPGSALTSLNAAVAFYDSGNVWPDATSWHSVNLIRSSGTSQFYIDNAPTVSTSGSSPNAPAQTFSIGAAMGVQNFQGDIDEVRFSDTVRSSGWLATEYTNQNAPSGFYTVGAETPY